MPGGRHEHMQAWSPEEDLIIIDSVKLHGHQWRLIVKELPGRSVSSTRNRFNRIEKGRQMKESGLRGRNLCHACWQPKKGHICTAVPPETAAGKKQKAGAASAQKPKEGKGTASLAAYVERDGSA